MTPPVAVAAYAASAIADANPLRIAVIAVMFSIVAFLIPFGFVYNPTLLLIGDTVSIIAGITLVTFGIVFLAIAAEGYFITLVETPARLVLASIGFVTLAPHGVWTFLSVGVGIALLLVFWFKSKKTENDTG